MHNMDVKCTAALFKHSKIDTTHLETSVAPAWSKLGAPTINTRMVFETSDVNKGLFKIRWMEDNGAIPETDITDHWTHVASEPSELMTVAAIVVTDIIMFFGIAGFVYLTFNREIKRFIQDPWDRMTIVGGFELGYFPGKEHSK